MSTRTPQQRTLDAEVRAVTEGHRAFLTEDPRKVKVVADEFSEIVEGGYRVTLCVTVGLIAFYCDHPQKAGLGERPAITAPGTIPCKHAALAARRWEREGKAVWREGLWYSTEPQLPFPADVDPFEGLS